MVEHTQEPWVATGAEGDGDYFTDEWYVDGHNGEAIATVRGKANALFIAAAPGCWRRWRRPLISRVRT